MSRFGCILMLASVGIAAAQGSSVPSFGSVEVPSLGRSKPIPVSASPSSAPSSNQTLPPLGDPAAAPGACKSGPALEPREYTQPEILGRPSGARARLCFYRQSSSGAVDLLQFYPSGHFVLTSQNGSGGFALSGSVLGTTRGTYGFTPNTIHLRIGYAATAVSQSTRGGSNGSTLSIAGSARPSPQTVVLANSEVADKVGSGANPPSLWGALDSGTNKPLSHRVTSPRRGGATRIQRIKFMG